MPYVHLTLIERELIARDAAAGKSPRQIAQRLGRHRSTITRELQRNSLHCPGGAGRFYLPADAQSQAEFRRARAPRPHKLAHAPLRQQVHRRLRACHSPEQIAGVLAREYAQDPAMHVSHECLYGYIYQDYQRGGELYRHLRRYRPQRRPRCSKRKSRIPNRRSIHERPPEVQAKCQAGHWESDSVLGTGGRIITHVERTSGFLLTRLVPNGTSQQLNHATVRAFQGLPAELCRSLTSDNGSEFAGHEALTRRSGLQVYFADPHAPWQRGLNENTNGLLRQFFPKGSDFTKVSPQRLAWVTWLINNRPRKRLNYQTPAALLLKLRSETAPRALQT
jgi:transposase, IS30 family